MHNRPNDESEPAQEKECTTPPAETSDDGIDQSTKQDTSPADTIPDGGLTAWLQVLGSFFLFFNSW